jgi:hypothetical protein
VAKLPRTSAELTRQNRAPPRPIKGGSSAGAFNLTIVGVDVTMQPFRVHSAKASQIESAPHRAPKRRSLGRDRGLSSAIKHLGFPPPSEAGLDEFVHLPRDGADIEQRLDALPSGDR